MAPGQKETLDLFRQLESPDTQKNFWTQVSDDVDWYIIGHTPMSGTYKSKQAFLDATIEVLNNKVLGGPLTMRTTNVISGGAESDWVMAEMEAKNATCNNGLPYDMKYCWVCKYGDSGKIEQVRAYLDTQLLSTAIAFNQ